MEIRARFSISADGYVTTPSGWPALIADPAADSGKSHGWPEFQASCEAVLMGRTTFEPALGTDRWPWPDLDVFVLGRDVPTEGAPVPIVCDSDPTRLLEHVRAPPTVAVMFISSAAHGRSRPSASSMRSTSSACWCCRSFSRMTRG